VLGVPALHLEDWDAVAINVEKPEIIPAKPVQLRPGFQGFVCGGGNVGTGKLSAFRHGVQVTFFVSKLKGHFGSLVSRPQYIRASVSPKTEDSTVWAAWTTGWRTGMFALRLPKATVPLFGFGLPVEAS
jgi:hypothetical protein